MERFSIHFIICLLTVSQLPFCISDDRLTYGKFISLNTTLISDGGNFALGFFSPSNATTGLYVGVWYNKFPQRTVVWVANRDTPIKDSSPTFGIADDTNLAILDSEGRQLWSSNLTKSVVAGSTAETVAVLLNSGNLVLRHGNETTLWQSFDHFTDTFIPGMKLGVSNNGVSQRAISWKSETDPSTGNFSLGIDPVRFLQGFIWKDSEPYWRSTAWTGSFYTGEMVPNSSSLAYLGYIFDGDKFSLTLSASDSSVKIRCTLDYSGHIKLLSWDAVSKIWITTWSQPTYQCQIYGWCGPFGSCDLTETTPSCKCLEGFQPTVLSEWTKGNFSSGCSRQKELQCGTGDGFLQLKNMKTPDKFVFLRNRNFSECAAECTANCSCTAYAYADLSTTKGTISRCLIWIEPLLDTEMVTSGESLYLRLASSELGSSSSKSKTRTTVLVLSLSSAIISAICVYLIWKFGDEIKGLFRNQKRRNTLMNYSDSSMGLQKDLSDSNNLGNGISEQGPELPLFHFRTIVVATSNFAKINMLGQGGFGKVYKGKLPDGQDIAVKRLNQGSGQGLKEFETEILLIAKLQHRNLVRLLGYCIEGEEKLLLYEYLPNKSLDFFLFDPIQKAILDWNKRFNIIKGIARALLYLHQDSRLKIIHRDLKPSNILLDEEMNPKVSDFGMARIFSYNQNQANTNRVVGTYGYMAPEYAMEGIFSVKSDVYSFGVLLLEIVSGFRNNTIPLIMDFPNLLSYAWKLWSEGKAKDLADPSMTTPFSEDELIRCINVGLLCVQDSPRDRPIMPSVVFMLENETKTFPTIKQPFFTIQRNVELEVNADASIHSVNNVTVTESGGR